MAGTGDVKVNVHYVTRVEGHGNIHVDIKGGKVVDCRWEVPEAPRFFEAMVRGRMWHEVHHITSRICGICSIGHTLASVKATEAAMGIKVSPQTEKLRRLCIHAENLQSHTLHAGYLVLPDLLGVDSVVPLAKSHPEEVKTVVRLHKAANEMSDLLCGRTTHPQRLIPGGFTKLPTADELRILHSGLEAAIPDLKTVAGLYGALVGNFPKFSRETEYIALTNDYEYALYDGAVGSTDGGSWPVSEYRGIVNEYLVPQSTAKWGKHKRESFLVGALARFNLNYDKLLPMAKEAAQSLGLKPVNYNTYMNTVAQVVECVHSFEDSLRIIDELLKEGIHDEKPQVTPRAGKGAGAVEVPRGILFHEYEYDGEGRCTGANCVIPTNLNHANIQLDFEALVPTLIGKSEKEIELALEMMVRAYDPCISCSTHYLRVNFVK
jgi:sulfhydrogenase subunit alpha